MIDYHIYNAIRKVKPVNKRLGSNIYPLYMLCTETRRLRKTNEIRYFFVFDSHFTRPRLQSCNKKPNVADLIDFSEYDSKKQDKDHPHTVDTKYSYETRKTEETETAEHGKHAFKL